MMAALALAMFTAMFVIVFVLRTVIQKRTTGDNGIRAGVLSARAGSLEWLAGWLLVLALMAGVAAPLAEIGGLEPITSNPWLRGLGAATAAAGIGFTFLSQLSMGTEWRIGIDVTESTGLVTGGAFALVRNPIFSAMLLTALGLTLMITNPISVAGFGLLLAAIELQVRHVEEPHLRRLHGPDYASYEARVGRFLPRLGQGRARVGP